VEFQSVADLAVEVDRQLRNARDRAGAHEVLIARDGHDAAREAELAVEPRVDEGAAVDLPAELPPASRAGAGRLRLELEARRIGVGSDDLERRRRGDGSRKREGDDGSLPDDDVAAAGGEVPRVAF